MRLLTRDRVYAQFIYSLCRGRLVCDGVALADIAAQVGTPVYVYSTIRMLNNLRRIQAAFRRPTFITAPKLTPT